MLLALALLPACLPDLPEDKTSVEGENAGDCSDAADNDLDGTFDCDDDGCAASPDCASVAAPPEGLAVAITPAEPVDEDDLRCAVTTEAVDPNGDAVSYAFAWTVDGEDAGLSTDTVSSSFTSVGQSWTCTVTPSDGTLTGTPASASVTIAQGNRAPSAPTVAITPAEPTDDDALTCAVVTESVDPDGDAVTYAYSWTVDGVDAGVSVAEVPSDRTAAGESWTCIVTATDGTATSEAGTASIGVRSEQAEAVVAVGRGGQIASSTDGDVWVPWGSPTTNDLLAMECGDGVCLLVDASGNAWRTQDQGGSWESAPLPDLSGSRSGQAYENRALTTTLRYLDGRWFIGGRAKIYVSDDALVWRKVLDDPSLVEGYGVEYYAYGFARVGDTVLSGSSGAGYLLTLRSTDGGDSWPTATRASSSSMPGIGSDCANLPVLDDGASFWAAGWSYCDSIPYNGADIWQTDATTYPVWSNVSPSGMFEQGLGFGSDRDGSVLFIGSSAGNGPYVCDRWVRAEGGVITSGGIGVADSSCTVSYTTGGMRIVSFAGQWFVAADGLGSASVLVASHDALAWRAVDPGFEAASVARLQ